MKKIIILAVVAFFATVMFSCKKEGIPASAPGNFFKQSPLIQPVPPIMVPFIVSDWFSLQLRPVGAGTDNNFLFGQYVLRAPLKDNDDVKLAYVKIPGINISPAGTTDAYSYSYKQLPTKINTTSGELHVISFTFSNTSFDLIITHSDPSVMPDANDFARFQYRYLVIQKSLYQSLNIDWSDYETVAKTLNFPL